MDSKYEEHMLIASAQQCSLSMAASVSRGNPPSTCVHLRMLVLGLAPDCAFVICLPFAACVLLCAHQRARGCWGCLTRAEEE